ncbi:hypothetical protein HK098_002325 [Nowakowskiella sp. JEL0407]|nr:hypothetical protein HK098_002325 [Nowakowskiella sp. JEL0407]
MAIIAVLNLAGSLFGCSSAYSQQPHQLIIYLLLVSLLGIGQSTVGLMYYHSIEFAEKDVVDLWKTVTPKRRDNLQRMNSCCGFNPSTNGSAQFELVKNYGNLTRRGIRIIGVLDKNCSAVTAVMETYATVDWSKLDLDVTLTDGCRGLLVANRKAVSRGVAYFLWIATIFQCFCIVSGTMMILHRHRMSLKGEIEAGTSIRSLDALSEIGTRNPKWFLMLLEEHRRNRAGSEGNEERGRLKRTFTDIYEFPSPVVKKAILK